MDCDRSAVLIVQGLRDRGAAVTVMGSQAIRAMSVTITTNNTPRECIMGQWLDGFGGLRPGSLYSKLREQFDYLTEDEFDVMKFFKYRGDWYCFGDFIWVVAAPHEHLYGWDGYASDSYFSGVVMKYCHDGTVIVGRYYS